MDNQKVYTYNLDCNIVAHCSLGSKIMLDTEIVYNTVFKSFQFVLVVTKFQKRKSCFTGMVGLSLGEKHFIQGGIAHDLRCDGRKRLTYRPILVETGVIPQVIL